MGILRKMKARYETDSTFALLTAAAVAPLVLAWNLAVVVLLCAAPFVGLIWLWKIV